jgi:alkylation response protein AidB-like acyl-CoA dehydrogenase
VNVDFRLSEEQEALRRSMRSFLDARVSIERLRKLESERAFDGKLWMELAEMGVFNLRLPESAGGLGLGMQDAVLVFEELGRRLVPGPLAMSHLASGLVEGAGLGQKVVGGLDLFPAGSGRPSEPRGGAPILIEHLEHLDALLVLRTDGVYRLRPEDVSARTAGAPLDPLTPVHHVESLPAGERIEGGERARALRLEAALLASAMLLGISEVAEELAVEYAKTRVQFGRPIGAFQAIKHIAADMFVRQELARAAVYAAGATFDDPSVGDVERAIRTAKLIAGEAAIKNAKACIQIHGGMGYTWEVPAHYYLKRTIVLESAFGTIDEHARVLGER